MQNKCEITLDGINYPVIITHKRQKNIYYRFKEDHFEVTAPFLVTNKTILTSLEKYGPRLVKRVLSRNKKPYSFLDNYVYIFGEERHLNSSEFDEAKLEKYLKNILKEYVTNRTHEFEKEMGINEPYKISVKKMKSRYGSNSVQTHRIHYSLTLVHYSKNIIDSVIYHELAHHFERNHSSKFYKLLYKYCPNYDKLRSELIKGIYNG